MPSRMRWKPRPSFRSLSTAAVADTLTVEARRTPRAGAALRAGGRVDGWRVGRGGWGTGQEGGGQQEKVLQQCIMHHRALAIRGWGRVRV